MYAKALPLLAVLLLATTPDEGQWLPSQIREMDWDKLRARGMQLTPDELWHPRDGGLLNAAVQINYTDRGHCTASFISPDGLLITNHHCGDDAVGELSTLKHNYLNEGFVSNSPLQELPTNMQVHVVRRIEDVTDRVHAAQARAETPAERYEFTQAEINKIVAEGEMDPESGEKDPMTTCSVASFFEGQQYQLYYRMQINDVRLVYAPPLGTADYGGNIDNWEWPRHSGDFVMFRAYVAPDGNPESYQPENVPYQPDHYLRVSPDGVSEGDLVMILGYPGQTLRYLSSVAVQERQGFQFPKRRDILLQIIDVLQQAVEQDAAAQIHFNATISSLLNIEKNHLGMVKGLARNAVVDRKIREEEGLTAWARSAGKQHHIDALQALLDLDHEERRLQEKDLLLAVFGYQRIRDLLPLITVLTDIVKAVGPAENGNAAQDHADLEARAGADDVVANLDRIQKPLLQVLLEEARNLPQSQRLAGSEMLADSDVAARDMVEQVLARTAMLAGPARQALLRGGAAAIEESSDPLVVLARGLVREAAEHEVRRRTLLGRRMIVGPRWMDAQRAWRGEAFYPDANSTLRISIAEVDGYRPRDAIDYGPFTTVAGMIDKHTGATPFKMPDDLREAAKRRWLSRFRNKDLDDITVCFLSNGDTTNGNSGSPVINGRGELVGLNFDRVFENVAGDFGWDAQRSRNISLDIRFVLWHLESVMPAPRLLRELGVE